MTPGDMTVRFELFVADPRVAAEFYRGALGFELAAAFQGDDGSPYLELRNGGAIIGLQRADGIGRPLPGGDLATFRLPPVGVELVLEVGDVVAYHDRAVEAGFVLESGLVERPWGELDFRLRDPDGHYLRVTSRRTDRYARSSERP